MWQYLIIGAVVAAAGFFLLRRWRRTLDPNCGAGCGCGDESTCGALQQSLDCAPNTDRPPCAEKCNGAN